jgi:hypothetical protein
MPIQFSCGHIKPPSRRKRKVEMNPTAASQSGLDLGLEQSVNFLAGLCAAAGVPVPWHSGQSSAFKLASWRAFGGLGFQAF